MSGGAASADVCYRHPDRASWTLCQRCGRTICPECQILTPAGVRCPDCVQETGGSVQWQRPAENRRPAPKAKPAPHRTPPRDESSGPGWQAVLGRFLRPGGATPVATWTILVIVVGLWIVGFFLPGELSPANWLATLADRPLEIWRYATAPFAYPSVFGAFFSILLAGLFFALIAPAVEATFGRRWFLTFFFAGAVLGSASAIIAGASFVFGLTGALFGLFGAYIVRIWAHPQARTQVLVMVGINLVFGIVTGGLPQIVGGLLGGAGSAYVLQRFDGQQGRTAQLIIGAVAAGFVLLAITRSIAF